MSDFPTLNLVRRGRAPVALAVAAAALMLLLGMENGQSAARARELATAVPASGSLTSLDIGSLAADDVAIVKNVSSSWVVTGTWITYTLTFTNGSTPASGVVITDNLPVELTNVISSGTLPFTPTGSVVLEIGSMGPTQTGIITITGRISASYTTRTPITNTAIITAATDTVPQNNTSMAVTYFWPTRIYLPIVWRSNISDLVFYDDFSNAGSGWPRTNFGMCSTEYKDGHYRVTVTEANKRCIVPAFPVPAQINGTFSVNVRRTSDSSEGVLYGFFFGAGSDAYRDRWALEVRPDKVCSSNTKGFFWLSARENDIDKVLFYECTEEINTGNSWNNLKVVRNGANIKVYMNDERKGDYDESYLLDKGYFDLEAVSWYSGTSSGHPLIVEFDDFTVRRSTVAP